MKRYRGEQYLVRRFWQKVAKTDSCWLWQATKTPSGYGHFYLSGSLILAHRLSWLLANPNKSIPEGVRVLHRCDTPACVRPDHLFLGTQKDNMADMRAKGREHKAKGERHGKSKLTDEQVLEVKRMLADGVDGVTIGKFFGVGKSTISTIRTGRSRAHILRTGKVT